MSLLKNLFKKNNKELTEVIQTPLDDSDEIAAVISAVVAEMNEEEEIVAAITATISMILGKGTNEFIVKNIKRTPEMDSIWAHAGRMKLMQ